MKAFQDYYPENLAHCYGCGRLNPHGHQIKTFWDGDETVTRFQPEPFHTSVPGFAYDGTVPSAMRYPRKDEQPEAGPLDWGTTRATGRPVEEAQDADEEAALAA